MPLYVESGVYLLVNLAKRGRDRRAEGERRASKGHGVTKNTRGTQTRNTTAIGPRSGQTPTFNDTPWREPSPYPVARGDDGSLPQRVRDRVRENSSGASHLNNPRSIHIRRRRVIANGTSHETFRSPINLPRRTPTRARDVPDFSFPFPLFLRAAAAAAAAAVSQK